MKYSLYSDGGARGSPGPAGCGFVIQDEKKNVLFEGSRYIGETTNNQAEYQALLFGLQQVKEMGNIESIDCFLDSELVVKQLKGEYKMKNPELRVHFDQIKKLVFELGVTVKFNHILRERNKRADILANEAMDRKKSEV